MKNMEVWIPLIQQLIWPLFIVLLILFNRGRFEQLVDSVIKGRAVEIGGLIKIGEGLQNTEIKTVGSGDFSMEAVEGDDIMIEKGGGQELQRLQQKLASGEITKINNMLIRTDKVYVPEMLLKYISSLGIKYIIFENDQKYDGWISASAFSGQLLSMYQHDRLYYNDLKARIRGINTSSVQDTAKTSTVLELMKSEKTDEVAVLKGTKFRYLVSKQDILTTVISKVLLEETEK